MNHDLFPVTPLFPKINVYKTDGNGRDAYIAFNNGGFSSKFLEESEINKFSNRALKSNLTPVKFRPMVENNTQMKHYKSDGTGRDRYIVFDEGGFSNPKNLGLTNAQSLFERNLRGYNRPMYVSSDDHFQKAQLRRRRINPFEVDVMKTQKELDAKLSSPKFFNSPKFTLPKLKERNTISQSVSDLRAAMNTDPC